jgi:hypothetical protein
MDPPHPFRQYANSTYPPLPSSQHYDPFPSSSTTSGTPNSSASGYDYTPYPHPAPSPSSQLPSTFLPSYYPENRNLEQLPSQSNILNSPSSHLLDGVPLVSPPQQPPRQSTLPTYDLTPESIARGLGPAQNLPRPWVPKSRAPWNELPTFIPGQRSSFGSDPGGSGGGGSGPMDTQHYQPSHMQHSFSHSTYPSSSPLGGLPHESSPRDMTYRSDTTIPQPIPNSSNYPGLLYGTVPIPVEPAPPTEEWRDAQIGPKEYAQVYGLCYSPCPTLINSHQALAIYEHLIETVPHIRPLSQSAPALGGQPLDALLQLSSDASNILSGRQSHTPDLSLNVQPEPIIPLRPTVASVRKQSLSGVDRKKDGGTKCLGCGATETPEWRRGPMGPRTLCNACVSWIQKCGA